MQRFGPLVLIFDTLNHDTLLIMSTRPGLKLSDGVGDTLSGI